MSESEVMRQEPQFAALLGIDWADQKHVWCLQAAGTTQRESGEVEHTSGAIEAWVGQLCQRFGNRHRGRGGTNEGSIGVHAQQIRAFAFVPGAAGILGEFSTHQTLGLWERVYKVLEWKGVLQE
jgi:hypothetical protein